MTVLKLFAFAMESKLWPVELLITDNERNIFFSTSAQRTSLHLQIIISFINNNGARWSLAFQNLTSKLQFFFLYIKLSLFSYLLGK